MGFVTAILLLVAAAYGLFFLYDWVTIRFAGAKWSAALFAVAFALNVIAVGLLLYHEIPACSWDVPCTLCLFAALICGALLMRALFFCLPKGTYSDPEQGRKVYRRGMYAACRHPGVGWYCLVFCFLALAFHTPEALAACALLMMGDVAYMIFQDNYSFPRTFCDYDDYRATTPFFLTTMTSLRLAFAPAPVVAGAATTGASVAAAAGASVATAGSATAGASADEASEAYAGDVAGGGR